MLVSPVSLTRLPLLARRSRTASAVKVVVILPAKSGMCMVRMNEADRKYSHVHFEDTYNCVEHYHVIICCTLPMAGPLSWKNSFWLTCLCIVTNACFTVNLQQVSHKSITALISGDHMSAVTGAGMNMHACRGPAKA